ncbi:hypothetical protein RAS12_00290 [Achromobacter seleniivolatilans]|uniref:Uncharacterized protein n=1 Tax=Achromobacter seleniivolatilans TaxID=3047478 RepID=A0ABY9M274_9BURK|nr:hypothetical protein [Achromobacter sp. R39]WMD20845.1 hypothetical protein RAS12_00290 [Achromobacter sp. R39]
MFRGSFNECEELVKADEYNYTISPLCLLLSRRALIYLIRISSMGDAILKGESIGFGIQSPTMPFRNWHAADSPNTLAEPTPCANSSDRSFCLSAAEPAG